MKSGSLKLRNKLRSFEIAKMEKKIPWIDFVKLRKIPRRPKRRLRRGEIEITPPIIPGSVVKPLGFTEITPTAPPLKEDQESDCGSWGSDFDDNNSDEEHTMDHTKEIEQNKINTYLENNGSRPTPNFQHGTSSEVTQRHQNVTTSPRNSSSPPQVENVTDPLGAKSNFAPKGTASSSPHSRIGIRRKEPQKLVKIAVVSSPTHSGAAGNIPPPLPSRPPPVTKRSAAISRLNTPDTFSQGHESRENFKTALEGKLNLTRKPQANPTSDPKVSSVQTAPTPDVRVQPCVKPTLEKQPPPLPKSKPGASRMPTTPRRLPGQQQKFVFTAVNNSRREEIGVPCEVKNTIDIKSQSPRSENIVKVEATNENSSDPKHATVSQNQSNDPRDWFKFERPTLPTKQPPMRKAISLSSIVEAVEKFTSEKKGKKWKTYSIYDSSEGNQEVTCEIPKNQGMLDLSSQTWYHPITWTKALRKLQEMDQDGAFLVRPRKPFNEGVPYAISFSSGGRILNCHVVMTKNGKYALGGTNSYAEEFDSLSELIRFYQKTPATLKVGRESIIVRFLITPEKDEEV